MSIRVLLLSIASGGEQYEHMKGVLKRHALTARAGWEHKFVYGKGGIAEDQDDIVAHHVEENLVPGVLQKTMAALATLGAADRYDYVIRTNLSTLWVWPTLEAYLQAAPRSGFVAGNVDRNCGDHMCGCGIIWSRDVTAALLKDHWGTLTADTSPEPDDIVLSRALRAAIGGPTQQLPRIDATVGTTPSITLHHEPHAWHDCVHRITHVRFKGADRGIDTLSMHVLSDLVTRIPRADLFLSVYVAQCTALSYARHVA